MVAPGRNEAVLADLGRRFGRRVAPVPLTGDAARDGEAILALIAEVSALRGRLRHTSQAD